MPRVILVGRCIEVWADPAAACPQWSASGRFREVRMAWLAGAGITDTAEACRVIPVSSPWSVVFMDETGRRDRATERLREAGADRRHLRGMAREAAALVAAVRMQNG